MDTNHIKVDINNLSYAYKAADRFVIVSKAIALPAVIFTHNSAVKQEEAIEIN